MRKIEDLEKFFELDLKVKKLIESSRPNIYNSRSVDIENDLLKANEISRNALNQMLLIANFNIKEDFNEIFDRIKYNILDCNYNIDKLNFAYENFFLKMTNGFEDLLEKCIYGYNTWINLYEPLSKCNTINDMLHYVHFYVINNLELFQSMNLIEEKNNKSDWRAYRLFGRDTKFAREVFDNLPNDETDVNVVSFNKHLLILIRDRGHALSIDIEEENNNDFRVSYFIPKICNIDKVNKLKGVKKIDSISKTRYDSTHGEFTCKKNELCEELDGFIKSVPTDDDMTFNNIRL